MRRFAVASVLCALTLSVPLNRPAQGEEPETHGAAEIVVELKKDSSAGKRKVSGLAEILALFVVGPIQPQFSMQGRGELDGETYLFALEQDASYSIENEGEGESQFENTSTRIAVDQDGDGAFAEEEQWFSNLPLRLGDRMFQVTEITDDGSRVVLQPAEGPLRGIVVGRSCPPFSFPAADGTAVTLERFAGKTLILDLWSVT